MSSFEPTISPLRRPVRADGHWRVDLLGGVAAASADVRVTRFPSHAAAALLARLALFPKRSHAREELVELLWPGVALDVGRNRLRQALSVLKQLLEPPGSGAAVVIVANRTTLRLHDEAVVCDAVEFERAVRGRCHAEARAIYRGELMPGFYDAWLVDERMRLQALFDALPDPPGDASNDARIDGRVDAHGTGGVVPALSEPTPRPPRASSTVRAPVYLSSFVGRTAEKAQCAELVAAQRLVTLTGMGGCGKTRLAAEVARACPSFDEVFFSSLADATDSVQLADRLRASARLPSSATPALAALAERFAESRVLFVLDNFEQLVDHGGPQAVIELLAQLPAAHALVTSRRALRVPGEHELCLLPFDLPALDDELAEAVRNPAVALFADRARSVRADFRITPANREDLLAVCRLLEGLPLALEIAASRVRTYGLREMRAALSHGFGLVTRSALQAAREPRHASLHAAIAWSWQLLAPPMQVFLCGLTVFRGSCTAADARAVISIDDAHGMLDALVADSLLMLQTEPVAGGESAHRFRMLEAVREFVLGHVDAGHAARLRQAHRACFLDQATELASSRRLLPEEAIGNFAEALHTALDDDEPALAVALMIALKLQWEVVATPPDVLRLMQRAANCLAPDTDRFSVFLGMLARLMVLAGESAQGVDYAARALEIAGDDAALRAEALFAHTRIEWVLKRDGARVIGAAREGLRLAEEGPNREIEASALSLLGAITLWGLDQPHEAEAVYARAEALYLALDNPRGALQASHGRMGCLYQTRRFDEAIRIAPALDARAEALGNVEAQLVFLNLLAASYALTRRHAESLQTARREARLAQRHHRVYNLVHALWSQGRSLAHLRRPEEAAVLMAFVSRHWVDRLGALPAAETRELAKTRRLIEVQIGRARCEALWSRGLALPARDGVGLGCAD